MTDIRARLEIFAEGDPADLQRLRAGVAGPGMIDWPDVSAEDLVEGTIALLLRPGAHGGAASFEEAYAVARAIRNKVRDRIDDGRRAIRVDPYRCPFDLQAIKPIPPEVIAIGFTRGGKEWLAKNWGCEAPLAHVEEEAATVFGEGFKGGVRSSVTWRFACDAFPFPCLRVLMRKFPEIGFSVEFEDAFGKFSKTWPPVSTLQVRAAAVA